MARRSRRPPIFDFHFHYWPRDGGNVGTMRKLIDGGDLLGILCCTSLRCKPREIISANKPLLDAARRYGRKVLPLLAATNPVQKGWREGLLRMLDSSDEIVGIKLHPPGGGYKVSLRTVGRVFEFAEERKLMIASHTCPLPGQSAMAFLPALQQHPKVTFIIYHASTHEESAYLAMRENVYVEPTWLGFFRPLFDMTVKLAGVRKLVAGTDGPGWFADFKGDPYQDLYELSRKMLPDMEKVRAFLSGNAARLLGL